MMATKIRTITSRITATQPKKPGLLIGSNRLYGADFLGECNWVELDLQVLREDSLRISHSIPSDGEQTANIHDMLCLMDDRPLTSEELEQLRRNLALLSRSGVEEAYKQAHKIAF
jgi:hypothetical protein